MKRASIAVAFGLTALAPLSARADDGVAPVAAKSWPQFHGSRRDNISPDTGLLTTWPKGGPKLIWRFSECGGGYSTVSIAGGLIFTSGDFGRRQRVLALDLAGKLVWQSPNGDAWKGPYPGARTTPTYSEGVVYQMNPTGRLAAFEANSGKEVWTVDLAKAYGARPARWALAENVIIDGKALLCVPGGPRGRVVALDKATGKCLWANTGITQPAAYSSPLIIEHGASRQLVVILQKSVVGVEVATGKLLWTHPHTTKHDQNVMMPMYVDGSVYVSSGHGTGGRALKLSDDGTSVKEVWLSKDQDNCHGGVIHVDGYLYASGCRLYRKGLVCIDFATGKTAWNEPKLGKVSLAYADGMLYCFSDKGKMSLVEADYKACKTAGSFTIPRDRKGLCLSHPVIFGGRMYVRDWNNLLVYDVKDPSRK